ncbi:hypothetical protein PanWU01x14_151030 [Parasponia andersonii]|uniref:Transmembrane protein n=1 Tax=Parasponia andersonii TaxID=3476 RepID=A0A2P5CI75_PARAD|nr:hypothetical protein PanWU01x14_151030 [Parasponia andersonii]
MKSTCLNYYSRTTIPGSFFSTNFSAANRRLNLYYFPLFVALYLALISFTVDMTSIGSSLQAPSSTSGSRQKLRTLDNTPLTPSKGKEKVEATKKIKVVFENVL